MTSTQPADVWREPARGGFPDASLFSLSGMEQLRAYQRGDVPASPLSRLIGLRLTQVSSGQATFVLPPSRWLEQPDGSIDVCLVAETAMRAAVMTGVRPGTLAVTAAVSVRHVRPVTPESGALVARGRTLNSGRRFTFAEAQVEDSLGRLAAHATASFLERDIVPAPPPAPAEFPPVVEPPYATPDPSLRPLDGPEFPYHTVFERDGLSVVRAMYSGELPVAPFFRLIGVRPVDVERAAVTSKLAATEWLCTASRLVTGGALAAHAGLALATAAITLSPGGRRLGVLDQNLSIVRDVVPDGRDVTARANVLHAGDDAIVSTAELTDADGNRVAFGYQHVVLVETRGREAPREPDRVLATVMFTDIAASTERASRLGDEAWRRLLDAHNEVVRRELVVWRGREIKTQGDGFLATFDSAGRAVQCAKAIRDGVRRLDIDVRCGLHVGECDLLGDDIGGIAVNAARRVQEAAAPGEILVSSTLRDTASGSGLAFSDRGEYELRGFDVPWRLYAVAD